MSDYIIETLRKAIEEAPRPTHIYVIEEDFQLVNLICVRHKHWYWRAWWWICDPFGWRS